MKTNEEKLEFVGKYFAANGSLPKLIIVNEKCRYRLSDHIQPVSNGMNDFIVSYKFASFEFQVCIRTDIKLVNGKVQIVTQKVINGYMIDHQEAMDRMYARQERSMLGGY
jgi:hypothetical protein